MNTFAFELSKNKEDLGLTPFFNLSPDLMCIAGFDGYFKRINPAVSKLLGYTEEELYKHPIDNFVYLEDRSITSFGRHELRNNATLINFENRYQKKNGDIVWLSWTSVPVSEKKIVYAIAKNITSKKIEEENRNKLIEKLKKVNKDLKHLTFSTSHDLRSPISNLLTVVNMIDISKVSDQETYEYLQLIEQVSIGLVETLNKKIDILSNKEEIDTSLASLKFEDVLLEVKESISVLLQDSNSTIDYNFASATSVYFNHEFLESIFLNLITNSIKYKKPNSNPAIKIYTEQLENKINLIYSDEGIGFNMEKVKTKVFGLNQKFTDYQDSKGIGLYLIHSQITSLGGSISIESKPNQGATFTISFKK